MNAKIKKKKREISVTLLLHAGFKAMWTGLLINKLNKQPLHNKKEG